MKIETIKVETKFPTDVEVWVDVKGFEGYYQISTFGRVRSLARFTEDVLHKRRVNPRLMKISFITDKAWAPGVVTTRKHGTVKTVSVNTMMFDAFIKEYPEGYDCLTHIDKDRANFRLDNLAFSKKGNWR